MSELWGHMVGVLILLMMAAFIGIWFWAWRPRHKDVFDALAEIPMRESYAETAAGRETQDVQRAQKRRGTRR